ncbi:MAG: BrnT family toxin, partial [Tardiphaga sp.]|nr:BrnT family toxin [Tardiphaga sp.]
MDFSNFELASFEWDEEKNKLNEAKHEINFETASEIFYDSVLVRRSDRNN